MLCQSVTSDRHKFNCVVPLEYLHIISRCHDHGIILLLPTLSKPSQNYISFMRLFGWTSHTSNKTSSANCIPFSSDDPSEFTKKILPSIDHNLSHQVTFIGKYHWQVDRNNSKNLHRNSETNGFDWLKVICSWNELFKEKGFSVDYSEKVRE